jgi:hypothetical protein
MGIKWLAVGHRRSAVRYSIRMESIAGRRNDPTELRISNGSFLSLGETCQKLRKMAARRDKPYQTLIHELLEKAVGGKAA